MDSIKNQILTATTRQAPQLGIEKVDYDPMEDLGPLLADPGALDDMQLLLSITTNYKNQLDSDILKHLNSYDESMVNAKNNLNRLRDQISRFETKFGELKLENDKITEVVNDSMKEVRRLDIAKTNLTYTMRTLQRMKMYFRAFDELEVEVKKQSDIKDWQIIGDMMQAVLDLDESFSEFNTIDDVNVLHRQVSAMKKKLIDDIFDDFDRQFSMQINNSTLSSACLLLEVLGESEKLVAWCDNTVLKDIKTIFKPSEEAGSLDNLQRRYIYFQNLLTDFESQNLSCFPKQWDMKLKIVEKFCSITRNDLKEVLSKIPNGKLNVNLLLKSIEQTLEFESYLNSKFKYHLSFDELKTNTAPTFDKSISDVFEPYLAYWIDYQGNQIASMIQSFTKPDMIFAKSSDSINVLESSAELFRLYRQLLNQLSKISTGKPLIRLSKIFAKYLNQYQTKILETILPDSKSLTQVDSKDAIEGFDIICLVINTCNYCSTTASQLEDKLKTMLPNELAESVLFQEQRDSFNKLINKCINLLTFKIDNDLQLTWREMSNTKWSQNVASSDENATNSTLTPSRYLNSLKESILEDLNVILVKITKPAYIRNLIDKMTENLINTFINQLIKSGIGINQFKCDLEELKLFLLEFPGLKKDEDNYKIIQSSSYQRHINEEFKQMINLCNVLELPWEPLDKFIQSYIDLLEDDQVSNFHKVLNIKSLIDNKQIDLQLCLEEFKVLTKSTLTVSPKQNDFIATIKLPSTQANATHTNGHNRSRSYLGFSPRDSPKITSMAGSGSGSGSITPILGNGFFNSGNNNSHNVVSPSVSNGAQSDYDDSFEANNSNNGGIGGFFQNGIDQNLINNTKDNFDNIGKNFKAFTDRESFKRFFQKKQ